MSYEPNTHTYFVSRDFGFKLKRFRVKHLKTHVVDCLKNGNPPNSVKTINKLSRYAHCHPKR